MKFTAYFQTAQQEGISEHVHTHKDRNNTQKRQNSDTHEQTLVEEQVRNICCAALSTLLRLGLKHNHQQVYCIMH